MQSLRRYDANWRSDVRPPAGVQDHRVGLRVANSEKEATLTKRTNEEENTVTDGEAYSQTRALRRVHARSRPTSGNRVISFATSNGNAPKRSGLSHE